MGIKKVVLLAIADDHVDSDLMALITPPLSILSLGSYLAAHDVPVELIDLQVDFGFGLTRAAQDVVYQRVAQYVHNQADEIAWIGISQFFNTDGGVTLAREIRAVLPHTPIIFGGHFPACNYEPLLRRYPFFTAIVRGDGEAAALEISRRIAQNQDFLSEDVPNLAWLDGEQVHTNSLQSMSPDNLPLLDFQLLRNPDDYQLVALASSRGCPFHCAHCIGDVLRAYRGYPMEWLDRQLAHLETALPNKRTFFYGPAFGIGRKQAQPLAQVLEAHRYAYGGESRVDVLEPGLLPALSEAGLEVLVLEMGSASPSTLVRMKRARTVAGAQRYIEKALALIEACFASGVMVTLSFMLPFPGDSEDDFKATLEFVNRTSALHAKISTQTGVEPGFLPYALPASIYDNTPLAEQVETEYPQSVLQSESFLGERVIVSPSKDVSHELIERYQNEIQYQGTFVPGVMARGMRYVALPLDLMRPFLDANPSLVDEQGVVRLGSQARDVLP